MRLIPQYFNDDTPPGEKDVFNLFAQADTDWVVFHSVDISPFSGQQYRIRRREIDFVVIIPDVGILCIEVKSHKKITFDGAYWKPDSIKISPFSQSSGASATFFKALINQWPDAKRIPVVSCCIFPNANFELMSNIQVQKFELIDRRVFQGFKTANEFTQCLQRMTRDSITCASNLHPMPKALTNKEVSKLIKICQPLSTVQQSARSEIEYLETKNESLLLQQQQVVLDLFKLNARLIVNGGAGTGKTLLSILISKEFLKGELKVGVFCFNRLVGDWLKSHFKTPSDNLAAGSINSALIKYCNIIIPENPDTTFWLSVPSLVQDYFFHNPHHKFDMLILDEAQDILGNDEWFSAFDHLLEGGLEGGKYVFLGDFENQLLFNQKNLQVNLELIELEYAPTKWLLSENCRNYEEVGENAIRLAGMSESPYSNYLKKHKPNISLYEIETYHEIHEQIDAVNTLVGHLKSQGYKASEITLLSFKRLDKASIKVGATFANSKVNRFRKDSCDIVLESIYTYKGMENKIIIYFDINVTNTAACRDLMYTGITRATDAVRLFVSESSKDTLINWLMNE